MIGSFKPEEPVSVLANGRPLSWTPAEIVLCSVLRDLVAGFHRLPRLQWPWQARRVTN